MLVLRWFKDTIDLRLLACDAQVSIATACRYLHEVITVIVAHGEDLVDVLAGGWAGVGWYVCLDGTLTLSIRCAERSASGKDVWYPGNLVLTDWKG